jgi:osmotically inducible protein OsmC
MIRRAKAVWRGTGRAGNGHLSTDCGVLAETPYSYKTHFENEKGTNPEELRISYFLPLITFCIL